MIAKGREPERDLRQLVANSLQRDRPKGLRMIVFVKMSLFVTRKQHELGFSVQRLSAGKHACMGYHNVYENPL